MAATFFFYLFSALAVASANVVFRDVEHITQAVLLPWFFLTPLVYSLDKLPGGLARHHVLKEILRWGNPATPVIETATATWAAFAAPRAMASAVGRDTAPWAAKVASGTPSICILETLL